MLERKIKYNHQETNIIIENGIINNNWSFLDLSKKYIIITDTNIANIYKNIINKIPNGIAILTLKSNDDTNSFDNYEKIIKNFVSLKISKNDVIISIGGNKIQNLSNFIASSFLNGLELIQIPTTLISQLQSSIIGKSKLTINNTELIGTNNLPSKIIIDPLFINTLPNSEILNGYTEIIKLGLIKENSLIEDIISNKIFNNNMNITYVIDKCLDINYLLSTKKTYLNFEENLLNFGSLYIDIINKQTKNKLANYELKILSMYYEIKDSLKEKLLSIYEYNFDINKIKIYIELLDKIIHKYDLTPVIEIIKIGTSKIKKN